MSAGGDKDSAYVDRRECVLLSPVPSQINSRKLLVRSASQSEEGVLQRSEVNVEVRGFRETILSSSSSVVSTRVRTVYEKTSSTGSSSVSSLEAGSEGEPSHPDVHGEHDDVVYEHHDDSAFSNDVSQLRDASTTENRSTKDSHYISQTYQISSVKKSSRSVTAVKSVKFKCSKEVELAGQGEDNELMFVDRREHTLSPKSPDTMDSTGVGGSHFAWSEMDHNNGHQVQQRMESVKRDVQQIIENSYMVSDISDIIDGDMNPQAKTCQAVDTSKQILAETKPQLHVTSSSSNAPKSLSIDIPGAGVRLSSRGTPPEDGSSATLTPDRVSPPRLAYSPGLAMRSYALEELFEKKSRLTPDKTGEEEAASMRFDAESSQVDVDGGSSVDGVSREDTGSIPRLSLRGFSTKEIDAKSQLNTRTSSTQDVQMFKLTKVHKVNLSDAVTTHMEPPVTPVHDSAESSRHEMSKSEEEREAEDTLANLVDFNSLQAGYRFHDVGMMQESGSGGICNPAFDDDYDEPSEPTPQSTSTEYRASSWREQPESTLEAQSLTSSSALLSSMSSQMPTCQAGTGAYEQRGFGEILPKSDVSTGSLPEITAATVNAPNVNQEKTSLTVSQSAIPPSTTLSATENAADAMSAEESTRIVSSESSQLEVTAAIPQSVLQGKLRNTFTINSEAQVSLSKQPGPEDQIGTDSIQNASDATPEVIEPPVHITRSFNVDQKFEQVLKAKGATLRAETVNIDVYYDTPDFKLTLADCWLRSHNGQWQLHANFTQLGTHTHTTAGEMKGREHYFELEGPVEILSHLRQVMDSSALPAETSSVTSAVQRSSLKEFARYVTTCRTYELGDLRIDLNLPEYGFWVGVVTATATSKRRTHQAVGAIDSLWRSTGLSVLSLIRG